MSDKAPKNPFGVIRIGASLSAEQRAIPFLNMEAQKVIDRRVLECDEDSTRVEAV